MSSSLGYPSRYIETLFRSVSPNKLDLQSVLNSITSATAAASAGPLDHFYARIGALNGPFFPAGWGNLSVVNYEEDIRHLIAGPPSNIQLSWRLVERGRRNGTDYVLYEGTFRTPCLQRVFDALPPESRTGRVQLLMPARLKPFQPGNDDGPGTTGGGRPPQKPSPPHASVAAVAAASSAAASTAAAAGTEQRVPSHLQPQRLPQGPAAAAPGPSSPSCRSPRDAPACVIHLAATGDQTFGRRLRLGFPLLKDDVCSLVLESPFYGARRPKAQRGSKLLRVSDLLTLGWATIAESVNLLHWLRESGYGQLGICGLSMGGVHASMTAGLFPGDVAVTPLLAPRSAAVAYCDGAMRAAMAWEPLLKEVDENNNRITQVVMAAGRAVHVEVPPAATAAVAGAPGAGAAAAACPGRPAQVVALMREATYALADLEVRGEKRHLAEVSPTAEAARTGLPPLPPPEAGGCGSGAASSVVAPVTASSRPAPAEQAEAQLAGAAAARGVPSGPAAAGGGSAFRGSPYVSVMDVQSGLAREFLWDSPRGSGGGGGGGGGGDSTTAALMRQQQQYQQQHRRPPPAGHSGAVQMPSAVAPGADLARLASAGPADDYSGPFSGSIASPSLTAAAAATPPGPQGTCTGAPPVLHNPHQQDQTDHQQQHQHDRRNPHPAVAGSSINISISSGSSSTSSANSGDGIGSGEGGGGGTALGRRLLGDLGRAVKQLRADDRRMDRPDTVLRLKQVLETYTDITRYPRPRRTDAAVIVAARDDAYVSCESVQQLHRYWAGSELRMVSGGHVSAFLMHQEAFREAIRDSLARVARPPPPQT